MPHFFSIDLGTSNCAIKHLMVGDIKNVLSPTALIERRLINVPFYYENTGEVRDGKPVDSGAETDMQLEYIWNVYFNPLSRLRGVPVSKPATDTDALWMMPSLVYKYTSSHSDETVFLTGRPAEIMYGRNNCQGALYENTKSLMDKQVEYEDENVTAVTIARMLLHTCFMSIKRYMDKVVNRRRPGMPETYAAVATSYPASRNQKNYLDHLKQAAKDAAVEAGLITSDAGDDFYITTQEPYAALLSMVFGQCVRVRSERSLASAGARESTPVEATGDKTVMVVDLGGGTSDICMSIIRHGDGVDHLPTYPETTVRGDVSVRCAVNLSGDFGGADIDKLLSIKLTQQVYRSKGRPYDPIRNNVPEVVKGHALMNARAMKHFFSDNPDATVYDYADPYFMGGAMEDIVLRVSRLEYNSWIKPYIESEILPLEGEGMLYKRMPDQPESTCSIRAMIENTLRQGTGGTDWNQIDVLYLTGGTSRMPEVQQLMKDMIRGTRCELIISDKCFSDIAAGAVLYAALNSPIAIASGENFTQFTPAPRSSVALMCDGAEGMVPHVLIGHSEALDGAERKVPNAFVATNTARLWIQLYTGVSHTHPNYSSLQLMKIELEGQAAVGTPLDLIYKIDQNMQAALRVGFVSVSGEYMIKPVQNINMDGASVVYDDDAEIIDVDIARGMSARVRAQSNRLLTTVSTEREAGTLLDRIWRHVSRLQRGTREPMMDAYGVYNAIRQIALEHLDVLCYAVMLYAPLKSSWGAYDQDTFENLLPDLIVEAVGNCDDEELRSFSRTLHRMLKFWPFGSSRWHQAFDLVARVIEHVRLHEQYRNKIIRDYSEGVMSASEGWVNGTSFAYEQLLKRVHKYPEDALEIFERIFAFFAEYGGRGHSGIYLNKDILGGQYGALTQAFRSLPADKQVKVVEIRDAEAAKGPILGRNLSALTRLIAIDVHEESAKWQRELEGMVAGGEEEKARAFFNERLQDPALVRQVRWRDSSVKVIGWLGEALRQADELKLSDNCCQELLGGLIFTLDETGEKREKAIEGLKSIPDGGANKVRRLHHLIGKALVALNTGDASRFDALEEMINAHAELVVCGVLDRRQKDFCWARVLQREFVNQPLREYMAGKLEAAGTTNLEAVIGVLQLFGRTYCTGTMDRDNVRIYAVPHRELAYYIRKVTGLNDRGETTRSLLEMFAIMEEVLPLLEEVVDTRRYREVYGSVVFDPLNVYFGQPGRDTRRYGAQIADLMDLYLQ